MGRDSRRCVPRNSLAERLRREPKGHTLATCTAEGGGLVFVCTSCWAWATTLPRRLAERCPGADSLLGPSAAARGRRNTRAAILDRRVHPLVPAQRVPLGPLEPFLLGGGLTEAAESGVASTSAPSAPSANPRGFTATNPAGPSHGGPACASRAPLATTSTRTLALQARVRSRGGGGWRRRRVLMRTFRRWTIPTRVSWTRSPKSFSAGPSTTSGRASASHSAKLLRSCAPCSVDS